VGRAAPFVTPRNLQDSLALNGMSVIPEGQKGAFNAIQTGRGEAWGEVGSTTQVPLQ
jgi:protein-L-isoaspartate O-methyltransferase